MGRIFNQTIKRAMLAMGLGCIVLLLSAPSGWANPWSAPAASDYTKIPPFSAYSVKPNIMVILDNSGSMNDQAYGDVYNGEPYDAWPDSLYQVGDDMIPLAQDDMEEGRLTGVVRDGDGNGLDLGTDYVGIRYQNVAIPQGAVIDLAYLEFTANGASAGISDLVIRAEQSDDATAMDTATANDISVRNYTGTSAGWSPGNWTDGQTYNSADITTLLQEIIDRPGWLSGNSVLFCISGSAFPATATGQRRAFAREDGATTGPVLRFLVRNQAPVRYYGYYNPDYFYSINGGVFTPAFKKVSYNYLGSNWSAEDLAGNATTLTDADIAPVFPANGLWDGNWMNWMTMRRIDVLRKVLVGGRATNRSGGGADLLTGDAGNGWWWVNWFDTSGNGPAVTPYNGNFAYEPWNGDLWVWQPGVGWLANHPDITVATNFATSPDDFYLGDPSGILQRIGDRARWGNMWFNHGETPDGGFVDNTVADGQINNLVASLESTNCWTWTPLAETFYVAMQHFMQQPVQGGLGIPAGAARVSLAEDPYYDSAQGAFLDCAKSFVLLLTDGASTRDGNIPAMYRDTDGDGDVLCGWDCGSDYLDDLAFFARTNDLRPGVPTGGVSSPLGGDQNIVLYTVYAFDNDPTARALLRNASRNGGFEDLDGDNVPDGALNDPDPANRLEWDQDGDGDPDTYYEASNGYALRQQLLSAFNDILARASSGTAASVVANSRSGEGALYQSLFFPATTVGANTVEWVGQLQSLMVDAYGNMREDTNDNQELDVDDDLVIVFTDDVDPVKKYQGPPLGIGRLDTDTATLVDQGQIADIEYLWTSSEWLNEISDADITQQRNYTNSTDRRHIFTFVDKNGNMVADAGETVDFDAPADPTWAQANDSDEFWAYIHPYAPYTPDIGPANPDFEDYVTRQLGRTVNYVRGQDQPMETVGSTLLSAYRSRIIDYDVDTIEETWRLGDIIFSTPTVVATPAENYDLIWRDDTYRDFFLQYRDRRNVVYVGANDGMLHAFNGGFYDDDSHAFLTRPIDPATGLPDPTISDYDLGSELWAYVPFNLLSHLHWLTDPLYQHIYYVDLQPRIFDAKIFSDDAIHPNGWGTVMVAGMRFGGGRIPADIEKDGSAYDAAVDPSMSSAYMIFDITDPELPPVLLAEITFPDLGFTTCHPGVVPMRDLDMATAGLRSAQNNLWYLLFGSGPIEAAGAFTTALNDGSSSQQAVMYAIDLEQLVRDGKVVTLTSTGEKVFPTSAAPYRWAQFIEPNSFVSKPIAVDADLDFNTEVVYFGTTFGDHTNGWGGKLRRIVPDIATAPSAWVTDSTLIDLTDIDLATAGDQGQPVTAPATSGMDEAGNRWVYFGTGRYFSGLDASNTQQQSYYGIKEPFTVNGLGENVFTFTNTVSRASLMDVSDINVYENGLTLDNYGGDFATLEADIQDNYSGWLNNFSFAPLQERNLGQAVLAGELLTFTTYLPSQVLCTIGGSSQVYALYYRTGTAYTESIFGVDAGTVDGGGNPLVLKRADLGDGMTISPNVHVGKGKGSQAYIQTSTGAIKTLEEDNPGEVASEEQEWAPDLECN